MADLTITTTVATLFSHEVYFELNLWDDTEDALSAELLDLGNLKYEFDIPNSGENVTDIGVRGGAIEITIDNYEVSTNDEIITYLQSAFVYSTTQQILDADGANIILSDRTWLASMYYRDIGDASYNDPVRFAFFWNDIKYDEEKQSITITLNPFLIKGLNYFYTDSQVDDNFRDASCIPDGGASGNRIYLSGEYIKRMFYSLYRRDSFPITGYSPVIISDNYTQGSPTSGTEWFIVRDNDDIPTNFDRDIFRHISFLALFEGAIWGSALGKEFYVIRTSTDASLIKEIEWDNVVSIKKDPFFSPKYRGVVLQQINQDGDLDLPPFTPSVDSVSVEEISFWQLAEKNINISFTPDLLIRAEITGTDTGADDAFGEYTQVDINDDLIQTGINGYVKAFNIENITTIEVEYWGISGIYPYSVINFDINSPSFYQSKNFRIKKIEYNFKKDKVSMELYEI